MFYVEKVQKDISKDAEVRSGAHASYDEVDNSVDVGTDAKSFESVSKETDDDTSGRTVQIRTRTSDNR